jgi:hypothetical protein
VVAGMGNVGRKQSGKSTRGSDASRVRPWTAGVTSDHPACHKCTWVPMGGKFRLKFVNRSCRQHGRLA